jgi:signal transduction histidine kinase
MKDELLSLVSHELRTPLHALMGFGRLLEKGRVGALNDGQLAYVRKMLGVAEHLSLVVQDILDMSHLQAGTLTMDVRPMALGRVVEDTASDLAALAEEKRLALGVQLAPDLPQVMADAQRVRQVLINLISNAIKFTPAGGAIQVKVRAIDGVCRCDVVDSGPGIALEDLPKLFKPFTQLDMSSTRENGGSGLGLAITKGIVEGHGGSIGVTSEPGKGSAFFFMLPAAPDAPPTE